MYVSNLNMCTLPKLVFICLYCCDVPKSVFLCICDYTLKSVFNYSYQVWFCFVFVVKRWSQCLIIRTEVGLYVYLSTLTDIGYWLVVMCLTEVGFALYVCNLPMTVNIRVVAYCTDVGMYVYANVLYRCRLCTTLPMSVCICTCTFLVLYV